MSNEIQIYGEDLEVDITQEQKYAIIEKVYASPYFDTDFKKELKEKVFEGDMTDKGQNMQLLCDQSLPDADQKERIWASITALDSEDSL